MTENETLDTFDDTKGYRKKEETYFDDGREIELLHFVYEKADSIRDSPSEVMAAIDDYGHSKSYLMHVGTYKGKIVSELIDECKLEVMVELGGYVGYSSILFGNTFKKAGGKRCYTLESSPEFAAVIMALVKLAGLSDVVKVMVGDSGDCLEWLYRGSGLKHVDMLFIDHTEFERDTKLCERLGLISPGTMLVADNCVYPGHPEYWSYVIASVQEKKSAFNKEEDSRMRGNPDLVYESRLAYSFEPSGEMDAVGISRCVSDASTS